MKLIKKFSQLILYVVLAATIGCGKQSSISESSPTLCSADVIEDYSKYEGAQGRSDFSATANYCASFLSKHGTQSCQRSSANGQTTTISYGRIEASCQEAQNKLKDQQSVDAGLSIGGFQNSCARDTVETYNRTVAALKALDDLDYSSTSKKQLSS